VKAGGIEPRTMGSRSKPRTEKTRTCLLPPSWSTRHIPPVGHRVPKASKRPPGSISRRRTLRRRHPRPRSRRVRPAASSRSQTTVAGRSRPGFAAPVVPRARSACAKPGPASGAACFLRAKGSGRSSGNTPVASWPPIHNFLSYLRVPSDPPRMPFALRGRATRSRTRAPWSSLRGAHRELPRAEYTSGRALLIERACDASRPRTDQKFGGASAAWRWISRLSAA
jgi:hypothetical protein